MLFRFSLPEAERHSLDGQLKARGAGSVDQVLSDASEMISGLSHCAGVVVAEKYTARLKQIEFVQLEPGKALVIIVGDDGSVENRVIQVPPGLPVSPQVAATPLPNPFDGLEGNRQVGLQPFPNMWILSGPLAKEQLPWYHNYKINDGPYSLAQTIEFKIGRAHV